jgi:LmbE family N-acetylglucosaminyl deacetylase
MQADRYKRPVQHEPEAPIVVLSPHLDDAVLSAWSVVTDRREVEIVNVFAGLPASRPATRYDRLAGAADSRSLMRERLSEDRDALALADRVPIALPFLDRQYRESDPATGELARALSRCVPAASALHAPGAIGGHPDHVITRDLALDLGRRVGLPVTLYAELPYAVRFGWPHWVTGAEADPRLDPDVDWEASLSAAAVERAALEACVRRLSDEEAATKLRAMKRYRTQFPLLNGGPIGLLEHPHVLPFEVGWRVNAARAWAHPPHVRAPSESATVG